MSTNCIHCGENERDGTDLLCDECRRLATSTGACELPLVSKTGRPITWAWQKFGKEWCPDDWPDGDWEERLEQRLGADNHRGDDCGKEIQR